MPLIRLALSNIYGVAVLAAMIVVLGVVSLMNVPVDILPAFKTPAVQVLTYFSGMPAGTVEKTITGRIERWVSQAPGVRLVESRSLPGVSIVRCFFRDDVDPNAALTMVNSLALGALPALPPNTLPPVVLPFDPTGTLPLGILTVSNSQLSESAIKDLARIDLRNMLSGLPGCVAPVVVGGRDRTVLVYLDPNSLEARNLSPVDVVKALQEGNLMVTPGTAYFGDRQVLLGTNVMVSSVDELNDLPIRIGGDENVILRDIGNAEDSYAIQTARVRVNGKRQVFVPVYRQQGASSLLVADGVREAIPHMEAKLDSLIRERERRAESEDHAATKLDFVIDQSEYVRKAIEGLIHEGVIGAVLVAIMILVFLGNVRMTVIAVLALPLAILCSVIGLSATGQTINVMTLAGMFLAIGPLVDNAIVVLENTHRHLGMGKNSVRAAYDAASELIMPVLVATLATIIVLFPLAMSPGVAGFLFKPLALAVAFAMLGSFVLAMTFVPALCAKWLRHHEHDHSPGLFERLYGYVDGGLNRLTSWYSAALFWALQYRGLVLAIVVAMFMASLLLLTRIGQEFFPQVDTGQITLFLRCPSDLRLSATERRVIDVEEFLRQQIPSGEREKIVCEIGLTPDWSSAYTQNAGQQDAVIRIQLNEHRTKSAQQYAAQLRHAFAQELRFADLRVSFDTGGMVSAALNFGASSPVEIAIEGGTSEQAFDLAHLIRNRVKLVRGAADVRVVQRNDAPFLILEVDRQKAASVGLSAKDVVLQLVAAMNSSTSINRNFWIDERSGNQYFVAVQYPEDPNRTIENLENVFATGTNQNTPVRLRALVEMRERTGAVEVNHSALRRVVQVMVNTENRDIGGVAGDIDKVIRQLRDEKRIPKGIEVSLRGEYQRMNESFRSLGAGLVLASVLVYLLMVPLLRSFVGPMIIMATVPLGLIGVLLMLFFTSTTLNIQSEMGVIFLVGIVVSQGVLLLDFANQQRGEGVPVREAVMRAAATRFRPILMTFLATFLDLLPMAIGLGKGSEALTPLARAVVGGLCTSTALMLFVVPILYTLLIRDKRKPPVSDTQTHTAENGSS